MTTPPAPSVLDLTRTNYTPKEIDQALQERLYARKLLVEELAELSAYTYQVQEADDPELVAVKNKLKDHREKSAAHAEVAVAAEARLREINAQAFEYLADADTRLAAIDNEIGEFLRRQEFQGRRGAFEKKLHGFRVYRARTNSVEVTFAGDEILAALPDLEGLTVEGDRLFSLVINPGVADRLIEDMHTPDDVREVLRCHRSEAFKKAPSIKIEAVKAEGGSRE